jgi:peptide chain release factor 1
MELQRETDDRAGERRAQVGTGERSEKIRTYNFPQTRVTDHRAGITLHRLTTIMEGDLDELLDAVRGKISEAEIAGDTT